MSIEGPIDFGTRLLLLESDITRLAADAVVNAANTTLLGGGGVDGAIHRVAGPELLEECRKLRGCATGQAKITKAYGLRARWIIHTVGPVWRDGEHGEDALLASCYRSCFALAREYGITTIAFPSISTGAYGFPIDRAARIALRAAATALRENPALQCVVLVCFDKAALLIHREALAEVTRKPRAS